MIAILEVLKKPPLGAEFVQTQGRGVWGRGGAGQWRGQARNQSGSTQLDVATDAGGETNRLKKNCPGHESAPKAEDIVPLRTGSLSSGRGCRAVGGQAPRCRLHFGDSGPSRPGSPLSRPQSVELE